MAHDPLAAYHDLAAANDPAMLVVTAAAAGERSGCLVGFHSQASIDPPRHLVFVSRANHTHGVAARATHLGVHLLSAEHVELARLFGEGTGDDIDKFARCDWHDGPDHVPVLEGVATWFVGAVIDRIAGGDHDGFLLAPVAAACATSEVRLRLHDVIDLDPGHPA